MTPTEITERLYGLADELKGLADELSLPEQLPERPLSCGEMLPHNPELTRLRPDAQGSYAWDRWQAAARAAGLPPQLAQLGRAVMREAVQHDWCPALLEMCGWNDRGQAMLELAQQDAHVAEELWSHLLHTDGLRFPGAGDGLPF